MEFETPGMFRTLRYTVLVDDQEPPPDWRAGLASVIFSDDWTKHSEPCRVYAGSGYTDFDDHQPRFFKKTNELETRIANLEICVTCWRRLIG